MDTMLPRGKSKDRAAQGYWGVDGKLWTKAQQLRLPEVVDRQDGNAILDCCTDKALPLAEHDRLPVRLKHEHLCDAANKHQRAAPTL
jgi:hypothetical protein